MNEKELKKIQNMLQTMVDNDQEIVEKYNYDDPKVKEVVRLNSELFKKIVRQYGLINISKFGADASINAWVIVQHMPKSEIIFMEEYLQLMKDSFNDINPRNYAYLTDKINVYKGIPQIYGTQGYKTDNNKYFKFKEIKEIGNVDKRRAEVNLEPLSEYVEILEYGEDYKVILPEGYLKIKGH